MNYELPVCPSDGRSEVSLCSCCLCRASFQSMTLWLKETLSPLCLRCPMMSWRRTRTRSKLSVWSKPKNPWSVQCMLIMISLSLMTVCFFSTFTISLLIGVVFPGVVGLLPSHALVWCNPFRKGLTPWCESGGIEKCVSAMLNENWLGLFHIPTYTLHYTTECSSMCVWLNGYECVTHAHNETQRLQEITVIMTEIVQFNNKY